MNGLERFAIEKIRVNVKMDFLGMNPTQAEVIAVLLILSGLILWFRQGRRSAPVLQQ
jgi:prolipoprotein diacylglyceryltransferase